MRLTPTHHVDVTMDSGVATLRLRNAKSMNVLGTAAILELTAVLERLKELDDLRVLVVRGSGDKAFIGGADIDELARLDSSTSQDFISRLLTLLETVRLFPAPVVARMAGWSLGAGLELAMACDLRLADPDARMGMPEVALGIPSVVHAALMPRLVGGSAAAWMLLTGQPVEARTACGWGLVHVVCEPGRLDATVDDTVAGLAAMSPTVLRQQKELLRAWEHQPLEAALTESVQAFGRAFETGEPQSYMRDFLSRRGS